jgi:hypothetical protein
MSYLPKIEKISQELIDTLIEDKFFEDFEITDFSYAKKRFCDELTLKFIDGKLNFDEDDLFDEDELDLILREIVAENTLRCLEKSGFINSYEDETVEETFFLTEKGKTELSKMQDIEELSTLKHFLNTENKD